MINKIIDNRYFSVSLVLLAVLWIISGVFPFINIEGDASYYISGCERLYQNGFHLPPDYIYQWDMQPLVGVIIYGIRSLFPILDCQFIYSFLSVLAGLSLICVSAFWISKKTNRNWEWMFLLILLIPESYSIMYYPNTAVFASLCFWLAFLLIEYKSVNWVSIILFGIAPLFRVDILVLYPFVLFNFMMMHNSRKVAIIRTSIYALTTFVIWLIGCFILKANPIKTFLYLSSISSENLNLVKSISQFHLAFYTPVFALLVLFGVYYLFRSKEWILTLSLFVPIIVFYYIYAPLAGWGPKHFLYLIPMFGILIFKGLQFVRNMIWIKYILIFIFIGQTFLGLIYLPSNKPWVSKPYGNLKAYPQCSYVNIFKSAKHNLRVSVSTGTIISTSDEIMPVSGYAFGPMMWHNVKSRVQNEQRIIENLLNNNMDTLHIISTQSSSWPLGQLLHINNYNLVNPTSFSKIYTKGTKKVFIHEEIVERNPQSFNNLANKVSFRPLYLFVEWDWQKYYINEHLTVFEPISTQLSKVIDE